MLADNDMVARAYAEGVSMGSELLAKENPEKEENAPSFIVWATRDALSAPLQRLQIVKGWTNSGEHHEQIHDVACADGNQVEANTQRCPDNGAKVKLSDCSISGDVGAAELDLMQNAKKEQPVSGQSLAYHLNRSGGSTG